MTEDDLHNLLARELGIAPTYTSPGGERFYSRANAIRLVEAARSVGFGFYGVETFKSLSPGIQPRSDLIADWTMGGLGDKGWDAFADLSAKATLKFLDEVPDESDLIFSIVMVSEANGRRALERDAGGGAPCSGMPVRSTSNG
jgi:hypothetical protein